jgi:hypothetical protein
LESKPTGANAWAGKNNQNIEIPVMFMPFPKAEHLIVHPES